MRRVSSRKQPQRCHQVSLLSSNCPTRQSLTIAGPYLAIASLVLIAGALLLMLLTVIGGAVDNNPTNQFYFLQVDTSRIPGAAATTRWTFWNACGVTDGRNLCPNVHPAYAFDPRRNFGTTTGVPQTLLE